MDSFWYGFIVGIFMGANIGVVVVAMCVSAKKEHKNVDG